MGRYDDDCVVWDGIGERCPHNDRERAQRCVLLAGHGRDHVPGIIRARRVGRGFSDTDHPPLKEYDSPADEIRQALTVIALEVDALRWSTYKVPADAIKESIGRIKGVCDKGIVWKGGK